MEVIRKVYGKFAHEYRESGDLYSSYGFGNSAAQAREDAIYGSENNAAQDHAYGFGDWVISEDSDGAQELTANLQAPTQLLRKLLDYPSFEMTVGIVATEIARQPEVNSETRRVKAAALEVYNQADPTQLVSEWVNTVTFETPGCVELWSLFPNSTEHYSYARHLYNTSLNTGYVEHFALIGIVHLDELPNPILQKILDDAFACTQEEKIRDQIRELVAANIRDYDAGFITQVGLYELTKRAINQLVS